MKKIYLIRIIIVLIIITLGGFFILFNKNKPNVLGQIIKPSPTIIPKVEKYDVPILMYHYIRIAPEGDQLGANLSVAPENFADQIKWLRENNYATVRLETLADKNLAEISRVYYQKKKPIVISFDDGYEDAYTQAFVKLKENGFIGTFFIIKDYIGRKGRLTATQIEEMSKAGMEFGSHTLSHPDLTKISLEESRTQIFNSKGEWSIFCYPAGRFNDAVKNMVREAGYLVAVTTKIGIARETSDLLALPRVRIENTDIKAFADKISYAYEHPSD